MSSALGMGATMRCIASVIDTAIGNANLSGVLGAAVTTVLSPDLVVIGHTEEVTHLNLFLYTVTMNGGWRNSDRMRDSGGVRVARPPLAVDLHFLMTAYGSTEFHPEILLGLGMQALYEQSFLDRGQIRKLFAAASTPEEDAMATSQLDEQIEQIKLSPHDLSADELYKLWSAFGSKCRPSAAYVANVVLVESAVNIISALPVLQRNLGVLTLERVQIDQIKPAIFTLPAGSFPVTLSGQGFDVPGNVALFGDATSVSFNSTTPTQAVVNVPTTVVPGINVLQVVRNYAIGAPPAKQVGSSNPIAFIVQPAVTNIASPIVSGKQLIVVTVRPDPTSQQKATLLLDQVPPTSTPMYSIDAQPTDIVGSNVTFHAEDVSAGTYMVRIRIAGTESVPTFDPQQGFTGPTVTI
jgi:hypothetical protein